MRLREGMRLRIKDLDFDGHVTIVRESEGGEVPKAAKGERPHLMSLSTVT